MIIFPFPHARGRELWELLWPFSAMRLSSLKVVFSSFSNSFPSLSLSHLSLPLSHLSLISLSLSLSPSPLPLLQHRTPSPAQSLLRGSNANPTPPRVSTSRQALRSPGEHLPSLRAIQQLPQHSQTTKCPGKTKLCECTHKVML